MIKKRKRKRENRSTRPFGKFDSKWGLVTLISEFISRNSNHRSRKMIEDDVIYGTFVERLFTNAYRISFITKSCRDLLQASIFT